MESPNDTPTDPAHAVPTSTTGPAYTRGYRRLLTLLLLALTAWGLRLALRPDTWRLHPDLLLWGLLGYGLLMSMGWTMLRSRTTVSAAEISQTGFWRKEVPRAQISYARFMRWPGLEWLVAPRLHVRTGPGPMQTFHGATPELWREFEAIAAPFRR